jgi:hypothetical protein
MSFLLAEIIARLRAVMFAAIRLSMISTSASFMPASALPARLIRRKIER